MNLIIIILAGVAAFLLSELYGVIEGLYAEHQLRQAQKKRLSSEIYKFKFKQMYLFMQNHYLECGFPLDVSKFMAFSYVAELDKNDYLNEKFDYIRGFGNGIRRTKSRSL